MELFERAQNLFERSELEIPSTLGVKRVFHFWMSDDYALRARWKAKLSCISHQRAKLFCDRLRFLKLHGQQLTDSITPHGNAIEDARAAHGLAVVCDNDEL